MLNFIIGFAIGGAVGILSMALAAASDERKERDDER